MMSKRYSVVTASVVAILVAIVLAAPSVGRWAQGDIEFKDGWNVTFYAGDKVLGKHEFGKRPKLAFDKNRCVTMPTMEEYCNATIAVIKTKIRKL